MSNLSVQLNLSLSQKLAITPQLQQALQILQMSSIELAESVSEALTNNPLLESTDEGFDPVAFREEPHVPAATPQPFDRPVGVESNFERSEALITWSQTARRSENDEEPQEAGELVACSESLTEHLLKQLSGSNASLPVRQCMAWLIGNLDEQGFLSESLEETAACAPFSAEAADWRTALNLVQTFDPPGVAARNVTESLRLQIKTREDEPLSVRQVADAILSDAARYLAKCSPAQTARELQQPLSVVQRALTFIGQLTPHPAANFSDVAPSAAIIPDVILYRIDGKLQVRLNPQVVPLLRFNAAYFDLLTHAKLNRDEMSQWKTRAQEAKAFCHALEQRFSTIVAVAQTIVDTQAAFFSEGVSALRPMVLRDVAQRLGMAESTVSRATAGKYLQTDVGTFELKYFFTSAVSGAAGAVVSATTVRRRLREIVAAEPPEAPLSDDAITKLLAKEGIDVARRTVAKYRELENIPPRSMRRRMKALGH